MKKLFALFVLVFLVVFAVAAGQSQNPVQPVARGSNSQNLNMGLSVGIAILIVFVIFGALVLRKMHRTRKYKSIENVGANEESQGELSSAVGVFFDDRSVSLPEEENEEEKRRDDDDDDSGERGVRGC